MDSRILSLLRTLRWTPLLVVFGLALRSYHYLREPSMWHDEAALVLNVLDKGYQELLGPLLFSEAAPPLFLWVERTAFLALGDSTFALRLIPFLASCLAMVLIVPLAREVLEPAAVPWAVCFFACSDHLLWHACEAKPYALDVLAAILIALAFYKTQRWRTEARLPLLAGMAPIIIFLVYPGCFLFGGLLLALLPRIWHERRPLAWLCYGMLALAVFLSFGLLVAGPVRAQRDPTIIGAWEGSFPDWSRPWSVPTWTVLSTLEVFRYCLEPLGQIFALFALVGGVSLASRRMLSSLLLFIVPVALALAASLLRAYPYCGSRILVYGAPGLVLLVAAGVPSILAWLRCRSQLAFVAGLLLVLSPAAKAVWHVVRPWPRADCAGAAEYVLQHRQPGDRVGANHWEYQYYFRHWDDIYQNLDSHTPWSGGRMWLIFTDASREERAKLVAAYTAPGSCHVLHREFVRTTVILLAPSADIAQLESKSKAKGARDARHDER